MNDQFKLIESLCPIRAEEGMMIMTRDDRWMKMFREDNYKFTRKPGNHIMMLAKSMDCSEQYLRSSCAHISLPSRSNTKSVGHI